MKDVWNHFRLKKDIHDIITKDERHLFRSKKGIDGNTVKDIRNLLRLEKENKAIKSRIFRDIRYLFELEENYYKPVRVNNVWSTNHIEYESNSNKNKAISVKKYPDKIRPYYKVS